MLTAAHFGLPVVLKLTEGFTQEGTANQRNDSRRNHSLRCDRWTGEGETGWEGGGPTPVKTATPSNFPF